jgi:glycosyltransferase involved in cell wall biosynthesis
MPEEGPEIHLSFIVIGFNEAAHLGACLQSVRDADLDGLRHELIYVDGGSSDGSREIAAQAGVDQALGGEKRRKAAENRNLGLAAARGRYVQFLDGDMVMDPTWPMAAMAVLDRDAMCGAVCGVLLERNTSVVYRALQLDWDEPEGAVKFCGGAALWRREVIQALGGFPEDVAFGEEPYLCWRMRNEMGRTVWRLPRPMALHDLAYKGFTDYWRRSARTGEAYAEIAARCRGTKDPLWSAEVRSNLTWSAIYLCAAAWAVFAPSSLKLVPLLLLAAVLVRKALQCVRNGAEREVAMLYAFHTYFAKFNIGYGIARWHLRRWRQR